MSRVWLSLATLASPVYLESRGRSLSFPPLLAPRDRHPRKTMGAHGVVTARKSGGALQIVV
jgi:hypothetical protein